MVALCENGHVRLLVCSDRKDRENDEFIEAHIYDGFDIAAVEQMIMTTKKGMTRGQRVDAKLAIELFEKRP